MFCSRVNWGSGKGGEVGIAVEGPFILVMVKICRWRFDVDGFVADEYKFTPLLLFMDVVSFSDTKIKFYFTGFCDLHAYYFTGTWLG